jgi:ubiquinone/menaquinone biosynthesis C-methylase UbiE
MPHQPHGAGRSSFQLVDSEKLIKALNLKPDTILVDLGCGQGNYSLAMAEHIGPDGIIWAVDLWDDGIRELKETAAAKGLNQIRPLVADVGKSLSLEDNQADICFMATVFHDLARDTAYEVALPEIKRILKPGGVLAIVEFNKVDGPPGPPAHVKLSPDELDDLVKPYGFARALETAVGPHNYLTAYTSP